MTYVQFPYEVLARLGTNLGDLSARLASKQRGANNCVGLGSDGQDRIQQEVENFRSEWKTSINNLIDDIGNWGGLSKAIGDMVQQFDSQAARSLAPPGSGP